MELAQEMHRQRVVEHDMDLENMLEREYVLLDDLPASQTLVSGSAMW
jgi:hypothetical protein